MPKLTTKEIVEFLSEKFPNFDKMKRERKSKFPSWFEWNYTEWYAGVTVADVEVDGMLDEVVYVDSSCNKDYVLDDCVVRVYNGHITEDMGKTFKSNWIHVVTNKEDDKILYMFVQAV